VGASVAVDGTGLLEASAAGDHGIDGREMLFRDIVLLFGFGGRSFGTAKISIMRSVIRQRECPYLEMGAYRRQD
jgi:hypothetical protein